METATGTSGTVLIVLAVIGVIGTLGTAFITVRFARDRGNSRVVVASTTSAETAKTEFERLDEQRTLAYTRELDRLVAENQRLTTRIEFLERQRDA